MTQVVLIEWSKKSIVWTQVLRLVIVASLPMIHHTIQPRRGPMSQTLTWALHIFLYLDGGYGKSDLWPHQIRHKNIQKLYHTLDISWFQNVTDLTSHNFKFWTKKKSSKSMQRRFQDLQRQVPLWGHHICTPKSWVSTPSPEMSSGAPQPNQLGVRSWVVFGVAKYDQYYKSSIIQS